MFYRHEKEMEEGEQALRDLPCCPSLAQADLCDTLQHEIRVRDRGDDRVPVAVVFNLELRRCTRGLVIGDLLYTETLLPGEKTRIATRDRTSRFSFDSQTNVAEFDTFIGSEESFLNRVSSSLSNTVQSSWGSASAVSASTFDAEIDNPGFFGAIFGSDPGISTTSSSTAFSQFARGFAAMAASAHHMSAHAVRTSRATSFSTVSVSKHSEGESESHYEAASRFFENSNSCHAITYLFHQIDKKQDFTISLTGITIEVGGEKLPSGIPGKRVETAIRKKVDELVRNKIIEKPTGPDEALVPTRLTKDSFNQKFESRLPSDGILVRACLDECPACEQELKRKIELDLERRDLENRLLEKQIELLEKHSDYRCCPKGEVEDVDEDDE